MMRGAAGRREVSRVASAAAGLVIGAAFGFLLGVRVGGSSPFMTRVLRWLRNPFMSSSAVALDDEVVAAALQHNKQQEAAPLPVAGSRGLVVKHPPRGAPEHIRKEQLLRNIQFFGEEKMLTVQNAHVVVVGLGGVGEHTHTHTQPATE
eukprot:GHVU01138323.1.p2 GENE.GHVU01138323.1~~GHVU01138323.1.p2  ORF type:complete len:149 (+),score=31.91 GHVU01138323.1:754-1200(+)